MYEETERRMDINWLSLIIKLVLLALFVFLLCWVFKGLSSGSSSNTLASNEYSTNIIAMKEAAFEYFTGDNLPTKVGNTKKLSLEEMVNQKLLIDFSDNGKVCSLDSSYVQATKTSDNNYALKVSLDCDNESDFIVTTIDNSVLAACQEAIEAGKACSNAVADIETNTNNTTNSGSTNTNTSTNNSSTSTSTNNSTSSSTNKGTSSNVTTTTKPSTSTSTSSSTKTTTTVKTTIHVNISGCTTCCWNCNPTPSVPSTPSEPTTPSEPEKELVTYYKHIKYGKWYEYDEDKVKSENIEFKTEEEEVETTCPTKTKKYYTTSYLGVDSQYGKTYTYTLQLLDLSGKKLYNYGVSDSSYFSSSLKDYNAYLDSRDKELDMVNGNDEYNVPIADAESFRESSLKKSNFTFRLGTMYKEGTEYYVPVTIRYYNGTGVVPYYFFKTKSDVFFVPVEFELEYQTKKYCYETKDVKYYREYDILWSTNRTEPGYTFTGVTEQREK